MKMEKECKTCKEFEAVETNSNFCKHCMNCIPLEISHPEYFEDEYINWRKQNEGWPFE